MCPVESLEKKRVEWKFACPQTKKDLSKQLTSNNNAYSHTAVCIGFTGGTGTSYTVHMMVHLPAGWCVLLHARADNNCLINNQQSNMHHFKRSKILARKFHEAQTFEIAEDNE